jgi:hypothetical protein
MPNISYTNVNQTSVRGVISGLLFHAGYYSQFDIELWDYNESTYYYTNSWIDSSGVNTYTYSEFSGLSPGTGYTLKGFVWNASGRTHVGNVSFFTESPPNPRPSNWSWSTLVPSASVYSTAGTLRANVVSATEWNDFCSRINDFRQYKNLASYSFSHGTSSNSLTSSMVMEAINAISTMTPASMGSGPYSTLTNLANALNSIS